MSAPEYHRQQLAANFQAELNTLLAKEIEWEETVLVTVAKVESSIDGQHIMVSVTVLPQLHQDQVLAKLQSHSKNLAFQLGKLLGMRRVPKLRFKLGGDDFVLTEKEN